MFKEKEILEKLLDISLVKPVISSDGEVFVAPYLEKQKNFYFQLLIWLQSHYGYLVKINIVDLLDEIVKIKNCEFNEEFLELYKKVLL